MIAKTKRRKTQAYRGPKAEEFPVPPPKSQIEQEARDDNGPIIHQFRNPKGWTEQPKEPSQEYFWKTEMRNGKIPIGDESSSQAKRQIEIGIVLDPDFAIRHADHSRDAKEKQDPGGSVSLPDRERFQWAYRRKSSRQVRFSHV
jgi:hypothetical protein